MKLEIEEFLDHVDQWKFKVHEELEGLSPAQRKAYWNRIHEEARACGLNVVVLEKPAKRPPNGFDEPAKTAKRGFSHEA